MKKLTALIVILFAFSLTASGAQVNSSGKALELVKSKVLGPAFEDKAVFVKETVSSPGETISDWHGAAITAPSEGWMIFIDDIPQAGWEHACRYIFVSRDGDIRIEKSTSPPHDFHLFTAVETRSYRENYLAENRMPTRTKFSAPTDPIVGEKWALIVNGGYAQSSNYPRYWNDLSNIYCTLVDIYGFEDDHIWVLCSDGTNPAPDQSNGQSSPLDLDGDSDPDIMASAVLTVVDAALDSLAQLLTDDDLFLYFQTDHGSSNAGWSVYSNLWNQEHLEDVHFAEKIAEFPQCQISFCFEQCYSGGFEDDLMWNGQQLRDFNSACEYNALSWGMGEYDAFVFYWTAALRGEDAYGVQVNADYNGDGHVSMKEAFVYANRHDTAAENPQYASNPGPYGNYETMNGLIEVCKIKFGDITIDDDNIGSSSGNGDGALNPGEIIELSFFIRNASTMALSGLTGFLDCSDPNINLTSATCGFDDMPLLGNANSEDDPFIFEVSAACPTGTDIPFSLTITDINDSTYAFDFELTCEADGADSFGESGILESLTAKFTASPNPFNPEAMISFDLPEAGFAELKVFDSLGREVSVLSDGWLSSGEHRYKFDGRNFSSGLYFFRLNYDGNVNTVKSLLIK